MKKIASFFTIALLSAAFISSCSLKSSITCSSYAIYVANPVQGFEGYFVTDDSTQVFSTNGKGKDFTTGQRLTIFWNYDEKQKDANPLYVEITDYQGLVYAQAIESDKPDTLGTAGIDIAYVNGYPLVWKCGGVYQAPAMINIGFDYKTSGTTPDHTVTLSYTSSPRDEKGFFHVKLSHSSGTDAYPNNLMQSFCSFILPTEAYGSDINGLIIDVDGLTEEEGPSKYKFTYSTSRTEKL